MLPPGDNAPEEATASMRQAGLRGPVSQTFADGEVLAGRFRVVRFLGRGGMGEVYEAEDLELGERVALKTIRPEITRNRAAIERFRQEIHLARQVTHPNVCRVFDVFHHQGKEPPSEASFLTMELLHGETLAERIRRQGRLSTAEARPLVEQMTAALAAAHEAGVIHRDFKSANVILVSKVSGEPALRAVVTDFGLARPAAAAGSAGALTAAGDLVGTPEYMAPEQLEGGQATTAVDIHALGVVMYEMVTGTRPFAAETPLAAALKRLKESPRSPRAQVPDLDPKWEAAILRCLHREPARRFARAGEIVEMLGGDRSASLDAGYRRLRLAGIAVTLVALLAAGIGYGIRLARRSPKAAPAAATTPAAIKRRHAVAVLGFKNLSGRPDAAWLSNALSEMLGTELGASGDLRTISGEDIARMKIELSLADADSFAGPTLARIRKNLGADFVVLGSYTALGKEAGGRIRLDLRVQDAAAGETMTAAAHTGSEEQLFDLVSEAGQRVRHALGAAPLSAAGAGSARASMPATPEAARFYSEGLAKLRLFDGLGAKALLEKAVAADAQYPLAHTALAAAWAALGYELKAREEARKAYELSANLPREERLVVEGRYREAARENEKAIEVYRTLWGFFPDNVDYGLRLARAQGASGRAKEALATVEALRRLPPPLCDDVRLDLAEARAAASISDLQRALAAAGRAGAKASAQESRLLLASARIYQANALLELGEARQALEYLGEARRLYEAAGDRGGAAIVISNLALLHYRQGRAAEARDMWEQVLALDRAIGRQSGVATTLNNLAALRQLAGDFAGAGKMYQEVLAIDSSLGNRRGAGSAMNNLGEVLQSMGDLAGARKRYEDTLALGREINDQKGLAYTLARLGELLAEQGDLPAARKIFEEQMRLSRKIGSKTLLAQGLFGHAEIQLAGGDLAGARKSHEEALAIREALGEKPRVASSRLALGALAIEQGDAHAAEAPAREAAGLFREVKESDSESWAWVVLGRSLLAQGRLADALGAVQAAESQGRRISAAFRLRTSIIGARVRSARGKAAEATRGLQATLAEAQQAGMVMVGMEARLALGEIETRSGRGAAGRARLEALEQEAKGKGLHLIARKASAAQ